MRWPVDLAQTRIASHRFGGDGGLPDPGQSLTPRALPIHFCTEKGAVDEIYCPSLLAHFGTRKCVCLRIVS